MDTATYYMEVNSYKTYRRLCHRHPTRQGRRAARIRRWGTRAFALCAMMTIAFLSWCCVAG